MTDELEQELPRGDEDEKLTLLVRWIEEFESSTFDYRQRAEKDRDYFDGDQWTAEEIKKLAEKNQPPVVMNRIFPRVNDTLGAEDENRTDPRAYPRSYNAHNDESEAVTDALRYWEESVELDDKALQVLENLAIEGAGGCVFELDTEADPGRDGKYDRNVVSLKYVPWDRLFWDPHSRDPYFEDALYKGILTWMHYSQALQRWPNKKDVLEQTRYRAMESAYSNSSADKPLWYHTGLHRVAIREVWWRELNKNGHWEWYYAPFTSEGFLEGPARVVWKTDRGLDWCPLRMVSGFVKSKTLERYGIVRNMIWPQDEVNKRRSKALWNFTMDRILVEEGAVENPAQTSREMAQGGVVTFRPGALENSKVQVQQQIDKGQAHLQLAMEAKGEIDELGPYANLPEGVPQDLSARSFFAQQQAGMRKIGPLFQHYRRWKLDIYRCSWWAIRLFWPEERWIRVRDKNDSMGYRFRKLNERTTRGTRFKELLKRNDTPEQAAMSAYGPEGVEYLQAKTQEAQQAVQLMSQTGVPVQPGEDQAMVLKAFETWPKSAEEFTINDLTKLDVDIVIDIAPESTILEHEQFTTLSEMARNGVFGQPIPPEISNAIVKASMLHNKTEILDAINKPPDPEQVALQQKQVQLQMQTMQAQIDKLMSEVAKNQATAQSVQTEAAVAQAEVQVAIPAEADRDRAQAEKLRSEIETNRAQAEKLRADAKAKPVETSAKMIAASKPPPQPTGGKK